MLSKTKYIFFFLFFLLPVSAFGAVLESNTSATNYLEQIGSTIDNYQTIDCTGEEWIIDNIVMNFAGTGVDENVRLSIGGQESNGHNVGGTQADYTFNFSPAVTCDNELLQVDILDDTSTVYIYGTTIESYPVGALHVWGSPQGSKDAYFIVNGSFAPEFVKVGTGIYFFGEKLDTSADQTGTFLGANVRSSIGSIWPVVLLSISVFIAFVVLQAVISWFGYDRLERRSKRRKNRF